MAQNALLGTSNGTDTPWEPSRAVRILSCRVSTFATGHPWDKRPGLPVNLSPPTIRIAAFIIRCLTHINSSSFQLIIRIIAAPSARQAHQLDLQEEHSVRRRVVQHQRAERHGGAAERQELRDRGPGVGRLPLCPAQRCRPPLLAVPRPGHYRSARPRASDGDDKCDDADNRGGHQYRHCRECLPCRCRVTTFTTTSFCRRSVETAAQAALSGGSGRSSRRQSPFDDDSVVEIDWSRTRGGVGCGCCCATCPRPNLLQCNGPRSREDDVSPVDFVGDEGCCCCYCCSDIGVDWTSRRWPRHCRRPVGPFISWRR
jgi:hypothetical protein